MGVKSTLRSYLRGVDKHSPYPLLYPFVMTKAEKGLFNRVIVDSRCYLEFGTGGSTLQALRKSRAEVHTVESSAAWIAEMRSYRLFRTSENSRLHIHLVDIGPTGDWGMPVPHNEAQFPTYSSDVFTKINPARVDTVLIDGRFRVACALQVIESCDHNRLLNIMIHDFWAREYYHSILRYLDVVDRVDTLALFSVKPNIDRAAVRRDYEKYAVDPR